MAEPERTCVGCRRRRPQGELVRCTLDGAGVLRIDRTAPGRGAWVCRDDASCVESGLRRRGFERAWRRPVPDAAAEVLRSALGARGVDEKG